MEEKRKKERRETRVKVIGFGALAVCYLAMALWNCWDKRAGLGVFSAIMAAVCAGGVILEREVRNAAEVRRLPLLRFTASCPETAEDAGYLEIEAELPEGWKLREEGAAPRRGLWEAAVKYRRDREAAEKERLVCPHCGGRAHHTVGGKEFCSLCLEEMRRE